jgi:hypothetical protein
VRELAGQVPGWATATHRIAVVPESQVAAPMTLVLNSTPEREQAFTNQVESQQDPRSSEYQHWLTAEQIGERFGLPQAKLAEVRAWIESQGMQVEWVSPSRRFLAFSGTAGQVNRAFNTELDRYLVGGEERFSVATNPVLPARIAPWVRAIRGLTSELERTQGHGRAASARHPDVSFGGHNYIGPADFARIYDLPANLTGSGVTIGILNESRMDFADLDNFRRLTGTNFANPTEIVPTAFGGVDPGPAYTAPPVGNVSTDHQLESTLDVMRAGSIAQQANLLLVVATSASGGIGDGAQYLINTTPVPAQVMSVSWGGCEYDSGSGAVKYWDAVFQQAAAEGISSFVCSGDAGAAGCDGYFDTPPADPAPISPNFICASSYATCVGGTEFNDFANPGLYWGNNNSGLGSALSYIPEGGWNEPGGSGQYQAASSGGGVSSVIPTPAWQTGAGVPAARAGRYTPDIAFSSSGHDGYFACFAAGGNSCVADSQGYYYFEYFYGTSAAAPDMAGIAALLDQAQASAQGNLNPALYHMAGATPSAFHDVTVATSGVADCALATPSMCNNSIPSPTALTGGEQGYEVGAGFDEVTGLGSLDISHFVSSYQDLAPAAPVLTTPANGATLAANATTAALGWSAVPGALGYNLEVFTGTCGATRFPIAGSTSPVTVEAASYPLANLKTDTTYFWRVQTIGNGMFSPYSACSSFSTRPESAAAPTFSPGAGVYTAVQWVTLKSATSGAAIYYTTNGSAPTSASTRYSVPIEVAASETIKAIAEASGDASSTISSAAYTIVGTPWALASPASSVTASGATLNGIIDLNGLAGSYSFLMGTSASNLKVVKGPVILAASSAVASVSFAATGLSARTTYYFAVSVTTAGGTATDAVQSFTSP